MIGTQLGNWIIDKELGKGGMGFVYLAYVRTEETAVPAFEGDNGKVHRAALKVLTPALAHAAGFVQRFEREIESLRTLKHPHIVTFYESGHDKGFHYYAMEYVEGQSLEQLLADRGRVKWDDVIDMALQVCPALKHAHDYGIIHRDLKPGNLLRRNDGVVKLADFGIAKIFAASQLTGSTGVVGTAAYLSPEQAAGKPVTRRSDLYSFGVVLYTLLTGRTPFTADSQVAMLHKHRYGTFDPPSMYISEIPPELNTIVCQLLEKDPERRPADFLVLQRQFERMLRRLAWRSDPTIDYVRGRETYVERGTHQELEQAEAPLFRGQALPFEEEKPSLVSRLMNRAWFVSLLLAAVIGLLIWGLWPASPAAILQEAERFAAERDWSKATDKLDLLERRHPGHPFGDRAAELRQEIEKGELLHKARSRLSGNATLSGGEAETFYLEGLNHFRSGRREQARRTWELVVHAFGGLESQKMWVTMAEEALAASKEDAIPLSAVDEIIQKARGEKPEEGRRRLRALDDLYKARPEAQAVRDRIRKALEELKETYESPASP